MAPPKPGATPTRWHVMDRASSAAVSDAATTGRSVTTAHDRTAADARSAGIASSKIGPNRGLLAPSLTCVLSAGANARGMTTSSTRGQGRHLVAAHHLEEAGLADHRDLRSAGEEHPAGAPSESVADEVGTDRPEVFGAQHRAQ